MPSSQKETQSHINLSHDNNNVEVVENHQTMGTTWQDNGNSMREQNSRQEPITTTSPNSDNAKYEDFLTQMAHLVQVCITAQEQSNEKSRIFSNTVELLCRRVLSLGDNSPRSSNSSPLMMKIKGETLRLKNLDKEISVSNLALETNAPVASQEQPLMAEQSEIATEVAMPTPTVEVPKTPRYMHPHNCKVRTTSRSVPIDQSIGSLDQNPDSKSQSSLNQLAALLLAKLSDLESPVLNFKLPKVETPKVAFTLKTKETTSLVKPPPAAHKGLHESRSRYTGTCATGTGG